MAKQKTRNCPACGKRLKPEPPDNGNIRYLCDCGGTLRSVIEIRKPTKPNLEVQNGRTN